MLTKNMTYINRIGTAVPPTSYTQEQALAQMLAILPLSEAEARKFKMIYRNSGISKRHTAMPDFFAHFENKNENLATISSRMNWFWQYAPNLCVQAIENCLPQGFDKQQITHLLTVSCTGLAAPGLDIALLHLLNLPTNIYRTSINFMGCYAAFHALKQADMICKTDKKAKVLVVCVELCSLHFQQLLDDDNTRANLIFSDGAAAVLLSAESLESANLEGENQQKELKINSFYAEIVRQGEADMAWHITESAFQMKLSAYIPQLVEENIAYLLQKALTHANKTVAEITDWAIHPGGKKIVDNVAKVLDLATEKLAPSYETLQNYGNMSSATILFVLQKMMLNAAQQNQQATSHIFAVGFGPGLTMESMLLEA